MMREKNCIFFLALFSFCLCAYEWSGEIKPPFVGDARPPRKIELGEIVYTSSAVCPPVIVVPPGSSKVAAFAARELQHFLSRKISCPVDIVKAPKAGCYPIYLGLNSYSREMGIDEKTLCRDAFQIRISKEGACIAGIDSRNADPDIKPIKRDHLGQLLCYDRGTLFGVYDFLERFAGVRFYFPLEDFIIVPPGPLKLPAAKIYERPDFEMRWYTPYGGYWDDPEQPSEFHVKNFPTRFKNLNWFRHRMQTRLVPNNHGLHHFQLYQRMWKTHPEFFAVREIKDKDGSLLRHQDHYCYSHGLKEQVFSDIKAFLAGEDARKRGFKKTWPQIAFRYNTVSLCPSDGLQPCHCPECWKAFGNTGDPLAASELIWGFTCDIGERLLKEKIPGYIVQSSYSCYRPAPRRKLPSNVFAQLAFYGPWSESNPAERERELQYIESWKKISSNKLLFWNYALKYRNRNFPSIPDVTPRSFVKLYQPLAKDIYGVFVETGTDYYIFHYLTYYIFGKLAWNNQVDAEQLLKEHFKLLFGPAEQEMSDFYTRLEELWLHKANAKVVKTEQGEMTTSVSLEELYTDVYSPEEIRKMNLLFDLAEKKCRGDKNPAYLRRVRFIRKHFLNSIEKSASEYHAVADAKKHFGLYVPRLQSGESIVIDGRKNDPGWKTAASAFLQMHPYPPKKTGDATSIWVCRDQKDLYVFFDCSEPAMDQVIAYPRKGQSTDISRDNGVEVFLKCSPGAQGEYFQLILNSCGSFITRRWTEIGGRFIPGRKPWEPVVSAAVSATGSGWTAEIRIPLDSLEGFNGKILLANFCRNQQTRSKAQDYTWSPFLFKYFHDPDKFGRLFFAPPEEDGRNLIENGDFLPENRNGKLKDPLSGKWHEPARELAAGKVLWDKETFIYGGASAKLYDVPPPQGRKKYHAGIILDLKKLLKPNTRYRLTYYFRCDDVKPYTLDAWSGMLVKIRYGTNQFFLPAKAVIGTLSWTRHSEVFRTPDKPADSASLNIQLQNASGSVHLDHIELKEIKP